MRRKPVIRRLRSIARLRSILRSKGAILGRRLAERPAAAEATSPDQGFSYAPVFDHFDAELAAVERELEAAENAYGVKNLILTPRRQERDAAASALYDLHNGLERVLAGQPVALAVVVADTPQSPDALALQVSLTLSFLRDLEEADPRPGASTPELVAGLRMDAGAVAEDLEPGLRRLEAANAALEQAAAGVVLALCEADRAFVHVDHVVPWVARALEGLGGLAGEERLAGRIRKCCG